MKNALEVQRKVVLETGLMPWQLVKAGKPGEIFILRSQKTRMETRDRLERGEFDHLKKGRLYKFTSTWGTYVSRNGIYYPPTKGLTLLRIPSMEPENRIGFIQSNQMVIYLDTVRNGHGLFHNIVAGDQVGYIPCNKNDYRLKRITSRMLRRMEEKVIREEKACCETEGDKV